MIYVQHKEDDGIESEAWLVCDDNIVGINSVIEGFDNVTDANALCQELNAIEN
jgi:hypothetical protein